jgi:hypothetical protein
MNTNITAILMTRLCEAEQAYHDLIVGCKEVEVVDQNGERIKYMRTDAAKLKAYIEELKHQLGMKPCGPLQVLF